MNIELQNKLYYKYPEIFRQKNLSMQETCMCWGIDCGDGWYTIIYDACRKWEILKKYFPGLMIEMTQVKEKYGSLCLYHQVNWSEDLVDNYDFFTRTYIVDICWAVEAWAEKKSLETCEDCGDPGQLNKGPWYWTKCKKHWEEKEYLIPYDEAYKYKSYKDYCEKNKISTT